LQWTQAPWDFWYPRTFDGIFLSGLKKVVAAQVAQVPQYDTSLPPLGRSSSVDLFTSVQPGYISHGPKQGGQSADLPPLGRGPSIDLLTWTVTGSVVAQLAKVPQYDTSLPPLGLGRSIDLLTSYQAGQHGAKAGTQSADLPPLGRRFSYETLPSFFIGNVSIVAVAQVPQYDTSLPPLGRSPSIDLLTSYQAGRYGAKAGTQSADLPPLGRGPPVDLFTAFQSGYISYGAVASGPIAADLPPLGYGRLIDLLTSYGFGNQPVAPTGPPQLHFLKFRADVGSLMTH